MQSTLANKCIDQLARGTFSKDLVDQVVNARDTIQADICQDLNLGDPHQAIRADTLNKSHVTRAQLCEWLAAVTCILDNFSVPLLLNAVPLVALVKELRENTISNQRTIIELQQMVIRQKDAELSIVKLPGSTTLSSAESCESVPAARKIQLQAMLDALSLRRGAGEESKEQGTPPVSEEQGQEGIQDRMEEVMAHIGEFTFNSSDHVSQVLKRAKSMRDDDE